MICYKVTVTSGDDSNTIYVEYNGNILSKITDPIMISKLFNIEYNPNYDRSVEISVVTGIDCDKVISTFYIESIYNLYVVGDAGDNT